MSEIPRRTANELRPITIRTQLSQVERLVLKPLKRVEGNVFHPRRRAKQSINAPTQAASRFAQRLDMTGEKPILNTLPKPLAGRASRRQDWVRQAILGSSLAVFIPAIALVHVSLPLAVAVMVVPHLFFFYATACPNTRLCVPVLMRFAARGREVWLTFDDGPDPQATPRVLALLAQHGACATFFLIGREAEKNPGLVREILAAGHTVGNHTQTHPSAFFWAYLPSRAAREIDRGAEVLAAAGAPPQFFRGPVGWHPPLHYPVLRRRGLQPVGWTARGLDYMGGDPRRVAGRLLRHLRPGAIFMLHPECRNRRGENAGFAALAILLGEIDRAGYRCVLPGPDQLA